MIACLDSSALLKLAVREPETSVLETHLLDYEGLAASRLAVVECRRAARRAGGRPVLQSVDAVLDAVYLLDVDATVIDAASALAPALLRSLDAIHLATARSLGDEAVFVTYDDRLAAAAKKNGVAVASPR